MPMDLSGQTLALRTVRMLRSRSLAPAREGDIGTTATARRLARLRAGGAAGIGIALVLLTSGRSVRASVLGATFLPDHAAPGSQVLVAYLPLAADCPSVRVYLSRHVSPTPPITSAGDRRLIRLVGTVAYRTGYGPNSAGPTPRTTTFSFRVPVLAPGIYGTYAQCIGGPPVSSTFGAGAGSFAVEPVGVPATTALATEIHDHGSSLTGPEGGIALVVSGLLWRRRIRSRDRGAATCAGKATVGTIPT
jgi:hypothetical protein